MITSIGSDLVVLILCEQILYLGDDIGGALHKVCYLIHGIGLTLCGNVEKFNITVSIDHEEAYGVYCKTCAATAAEVLGTGLSVLFGVVVKATCGNAYGYL